MFPSVRLAQSLLETGGKLPTWNNLGGIKVGSGQPNKYWKGAIVHKGTWEVYDGRRVELTAAFRAYDSPYEFYKDQDLLFELSRYSRVREAGTPEQQCRMLQACGYATDPHYASKLVSILAVEGLHKYDLSKEDEDVITLTENERSLLVNALKKLRAKELISSDEWIVKAEKHTLTLSELAMLNTVMLARRPASSN